MAAQDKDYNREERMKHDILQLCSEITVTNRMYHHQLELFKKVVGGHLA